MKNENLTDTAYQKILDMISTGELAPGSLISHRQLALRLELSKQPVGSALERLEYDGIVKALPRVGTIVVPVNSAEMWGWCQWRCAIESRCAALAAERITPEQLQELEHLALTIDALLAADAPRPEQFHHDIAFHRFLGECSNCHRLAAELRKLNIYCFKMQLCDALQMVSEEERSKRIPHKNIVDALCSGDGKRAAEVMTAHLESSLEMTVLGKFK